MRDIKDVPFRVSACSAESFCKNSMYAELIRQKERKPNLVYSLKKIHISECSDRLRILTLLADQ
jgi:hypothetical protein